MPVSKTDENNRESSVLDLAFRSSTEEDIPFLCHLMTVTIREFMEAAEIPPFEQEAAIKRLSTRIWEIVTNHNIPVAAICYVPYGNLIHVKALHVLPEFQNRRIGTSMLFQLMQQADATSSGIRLEVHFVNPRAKAFYERLGFVAVEKTFTQDIMYRPPNGKPLRTGLWETLKRIFSPFDLPWENKNIKV